MNANAGSLTLPPIEELREQIAEWRRKQAAGQLTTEEMRAIVAVLRQGRIAAAQTSARARSARAPVDADALLDKLL